MGNCRSTESSNPSKVGTSDASPLCSNPSSWPPVAMTFSRPELGQRHGQRRFRHAVSGVGVDQRAVGQRRAVGPVQIGEDPVDGELLCRSTFAVEANPEGVEELLDGQGAQHLGRRQVRWRRRDRSAELLGPAQVDVAPQTVLRAETEFLQGLGEQFPGLPVTRIGEDHVTDHRRHPAQITVVEVGLGLVQHRIGAAHELDVPLGLLLRRVGPEMRRVGVVPAEIPLVDGLDVVAERSVVATVVPDAGQPRRQLELFGDLGADQPLVHPPQRLVVQVRVGVALLGQEGGDALGAPDRPVVRGEHHVGVGAEQPDRLAQIARPAARIADLGATQGQDLVQRVSGVLGHAQRPEVREEEVHLGRRLGARGDLEDHLHAVDGRFLPGVGDIDRRRHQRDGAVRGRLTQAGADLPGRTGRQVGGVDVRRPPRHRRPGVDVLGHGVFQESDRSVDRRVGIGDPADAAVVVGV